MEEEKLINFEKQNKINRDIFELLFEKHKLNFLESKFALEQALIPINLMSQNKLDNAMLEGLKKAKGLN